MIGSARGVHSRPSAVVATAAPLVPAGALPLAAKTDILDEANAALGKRMRGKRGMNRRRWPLGAIFLTISELCLTLFRATPDLLAMLDASLIAGWLIEEP